MGKKSEALLTAEAKIEELEKELKWAGTEKMKAIEQAIEPYKAELYEWAKLVKVILAVVEEDNVLPAYVLQAALDRIDNSKKLISDKTE